MLGSVTFAAKKGRSLLKAGVVVRTARAACSPVLGLRRCSGPVKLVVGVVGGAMVVTRFARGRPRLLVLWLWSMGAGIVTLGGETGLTLGGATGFTLGGETGLLGAAGDMLVIGAWVSVGVGIVGLRAALCFWRARAYFWKMEARRR